MSKRNLFGDKSDVVIESKDDSIRVEKAGNRYNLQAGAGGTGSKINLDSLEINDEGELTVRTSGVITTAYPEYYGQGVHLFYNPVQFNGLLGMLSINMPVAIANEVTAAGETKPRGLGVLAWRDKVDYLTEVINKPVDASGVDPNQLGTLAFKNTADYSTEITGKPDLTVYARNDQLGDLARQTQVDWNLQIKNRPDLDVYALKGATIDLTTLATGTLGVDHGGTGAATAAGARTNLGLKALATKDQADWNTDLVNIDLYAALNPKLVAGTGIGIAANGTAKTITINNTAVPPDLTPYATTAAVSAGYQPKHAVLTGLSAATPTFTATLVTQAVIPSTSSNYNIGGTANRYVTGYFNNLDFAGTLTGDIYPNLKPKLVAGTNVSLVVDDVGKTITVNNTQSLAAYATTAAVAGGFQPLHAVLTALASATPTFNAAVTGQQIAPSTTNTYSLGTAAARYSAVYATNLDFAGTLTGDIYPNLKPRFLAGTNIGLTVDDVGKTITVNNTQSLTAYATTAAVAAGYQPLHAVLTGLASATPTFTASVTSQQVAPSTTNTYSLGTTALRYSNAYLTNLDFTGTLTGNLYPNLLTYLQAGAGITLTPNATSKTLTITNSKTPVDLSGNDVFGILPASKVDLSQVKISTTTRNITTTSGTTTVSTTNRTVPQTAFTSNAGNTVSGLTMTCTASTAAVDAWKVFDGNNATYWRGTTAYGYFMSAESFSQSAIPGGASDYLNVTWSGGTVVPKQLSYYVGNYNDQPAVLVVLGSNDGTTWTQITMWAPNPRFAAGTWIGVTLPNTTAYSQLRIRIDGWYGDSNVTPPGTNVYCSMYGLSINADVGISTTTNTTTTTPTTVPYLNQAVIDSPQLNGALTLGANNEATIVRAPGTTADLTVQNTGTGHMRLLSGSGTVHINASEFTSPYNGDNIIRVGRNRTTDGWSYLDLYGTTTGGDYFRFTRTPGVNADASITNTGTGVVYFSSGGHMYLNAAVGKNISMQGALVCPYSTNTTYLGSSGNAWIQVNSYGYATISDEREKTGITPLGDGLDLINKLEPITFQYKAGTDQRTRMGLGAHRTKEVMDAAGKTNYGLVETSTDPWGVNYQELVAPLIGAIQALTKQVSDLRTRVGVIEQKTARLPII